MKPGATAAALRAVRRALGAVVIAALSLVVLLAAIAAFRRHPQDMPWTRLALGDPVGAFTGRKLTALTRDLPRCLGLLDDAGVRYERLPAVHHGVCGYDDAVRFTRGGSRGVAYSPAGLGTSCAVAASLAIWEWQFIQPAARSLFGSPVVAIEHYGSYNCRRIGGGEAGSWSEHATADAVDISGFRLGDGRRITVAADWGGGDQRAVFLRRVRNGACRLFATTLSPDYNAAHRDHLHLDQAKRGALGWRACR